MVPRRTCVHCRPLRGHRSRFTCPPRKNRALRFLETGRSFFLASPPLSPDTVQWRYNVEWRGEPSQGHRRTMTTRSKRGMQPTMRRTGNDPRIPGLWLQFRVVATGGYRCPFNASGIPALQKKFARSIKKSSRYFPFETLLRTFPLPFGLKVCGKEYII